MQPVRIDGDNFYASVSAAALMLMAALAVYGFVVSIGARAPSRAPAGIA